jgi:CRP/FNR family cyclic AMP-dependent transcriptional regulator
MGEGRRHTGEPPEWIKLLSEVDVLESLAPQEIERLAHRTPQRSLQSGQIVYEKGDAPGPLFLLLKGRIRLYATAAGGELTFDLLQASTIFGESSLTERPHPETAQALEPALVGLLSLNAFWQLVRENPEVNARVMKLVVNRSCANRNRMMDIGLKEVTARLASLILDLISSHGVVTREGYYRINSRYTQEELATMIGAKRVSVTRAFKALQEVGGVQLQRRYIYIIDLSALKQLAAGV